jgi:hypothetical protein
VAWEAHGADAKGKLLEYRQHTRSCVAEREFHGPSEDAAMHEFLAQHLAFLPVDFYDLVRLCRQLRLALQQSSHSLSLVSSLCAREDEASAAEREDRRSERRSTCSMAGGNELEVMIGASIKVEGTTRSPTVAQATVPAAAAPAPIKSRMMKAMKRKSKTSSEHSDVYSEHVERPPSSWKFCPGVLRVYERWFGNRPKESQDGKTAWFTAYGRRILKRSVSTGETENQGEVRLSINNSANDGSASIVPPAPATAPPAARLTRRKSLNDWTLSQGGSMTQVAALTTTLQGRLPMDNERAGAPVNPANLFSEPQWQALKLLFTLLDVNGNGVLMEESFVVLLAEQDAGACCAIGGLVGCEDGGLTCVVPDRRVRDGGGAGHPARGHGLQRRRTHNGARLLALRLPRVLAVEALGGMTRSVIRLVYKPLTRLRSCILCPRLGAAPSAWQPWSR